MSPTVHKCLCKLLLFSLHDSLFACEGTLNACDHLLNAPAPLNCNENVYTSVEKRSESINLTLKYQLIIDQFLFRSKGFLNN